MHRLRFLAFAVLLLAASLLGVATPGARAASTNVWATLATARPGVGCTVDVGVEVRSGGEPVTGISVEVAFFGGDEVLSTDEATTDGDGIATLAFDTSAASAGTDGWLDINVDGTYAGGTSIDPRDGGDCDGDAVQLSKVLDVGLVSASSGDDRAAAGFPTHKQERSLSCEYASLQIATAALGDEIPESVFLDAIPQADNPHVGYRGDIDGEWGRTDDYGVYAEPLADALPAQGFTGEVWYDPSAGALQAQLDAGNPTLIWIATRGDTGFYEQDADGNSFKLVPYEHVVVALAYDDAGVYVSDPGNGTIEQLSWDWLLPAWAVLDGMALSVSY